VQVDDPFLSIAQKAKLSPETKKLRKEEKKRHPIYSTQSTQAKPSHSFPKTLGSDRHSYSTHMKFLDLKVKGRRRASKSETKSKQKLLLFGLIYVDE
jgi:hypothetical protein